jgi:hypothetical protein
VPEAVQVGPCDPGSRGAVRQRWPMVSWCGGRPMNVTEAAVWLPGGPGPGPEGEERPARDDDDLDDVGFVHCTDPDGNGWTVQRISARGLPSQPTPPPA